MKNAWFDASKEGLAKVVADKPKIFLIHELLSNAWDTGCKNVNISLKKVPGRPLAELTVEDDHPEGFKNLSHAWTLFAESERKDDPESAGRFCMGEKLVLACCEAAEITTTTGRVTFNDEGRKESRHKTQGGSVFWARVKMTHQEFDQVLKDMDQVLYRPDVAVRLTVLGDAPSTQFMQSRDPLTTFEATLQTVIGDDGGSLRRTRRKAQVEVYETRGGEPGMLYELGIPVVATGDTYHVNVRQKVPLNMDRDNVPPAFLRELRGHVLNATASLLPEEAASEGWVTEALSSKTVESDAVKKAVVKRFGDKAAIYDPSDREANSRLTGEGYTVISGGSLPKAAWQNIRSSGALAPSGRLSPTHRPYSDNPNAPPVKVIEREKWTRGMEEVAKLAQWLARKIFEFDIEVRIVHTTNNFGGAYGGRVMDFNLMKLGHWWFDEGALENVVSLIIHELAHEEEEDHLSKNYYKAMQRIAGRVVDLAVQHPERFKPFHSSRKG